MIKTHKHKTTLILSAKLCFLKMIPTILWLISLPQKIYQYIFLQDESLVYLPILPFISYVESAQQLSAEVFSLSNFHFEDSLQLLDLMYFLSRSVKLQIWRLNIRTVRPVCIFSVSQIQICLGK